MGLRLGLGRTLIKLGRFIQSLSVMVMKPDDLVAFSRQTYSTQESIEGWSDSKLVELGLYPNESFLLEQLPLRRGELLLLGVGGGREIISLAEKGFTVTGLDFIPELVEKAKENAFEKGIKMTGVTQEISNLDLNSDHYDVVWLSYGMYSCVPTRKRRIKMLRQIRKALKPGGCCVCQFFWNPERRFSPFAEILRKSIAIITLGNLRHERGDELWNNIEFSHSFQSEKELTEEFKESGFDTYFLEIPKGRRGGAILQKPVSS